MIELDALWKRGKDFLGTRYPIIAGAMTWISDSHFTAAVSEAGAFGSLAAGNMPPELLHEEIQRVRQATDKPFAVNLITIAPNYKEHLRVAVKNKVPFIVFAGSFPRRPEIRAAKESGARVMSFASTESMARHLIDNGVDALILEGSEAGGHVGHVSLGILLQQVLFRVQDVPIFTAGCSWERPGSSWARILCARRSVGPIRVSRRPLSGPEPGMQYLRLRSVRTSGSWPFEPCAIRGWTSSISCRWSS